MRVNVWTVNEPDDLRRLRDAGVDAVITDDADLDRSRRSVRSRQGRG